jgi:DGQHR domain-containing protein
LNDRTINRRALLVQQSKGIPIYVFALTADELERVAEISRVSRDETGELIGYQRPEVRKHVDSIVDYLDSDGPIFPNAIILSLSSRCRFTRSRGPNVDDGVVAAGSLEIPIPGPGELRPAWIVDGQQRTLALQRARNREFPVPIAAFVADTVEVQREQFVRINSAKPLPAGLVTELLPKIAAPINPNLALRRIPSALVDQLNQQSDSPFAGMIKRSSMSMEHRRQAVITDTSLVKALEEALQSPSSCLFPYRNIATGETDIDSIWAVLLAYWSGVRDTFPEAWGLPSTRSRLMHGVGIRSMGRLMDRVMSTIDPTAEDAVSKVRAELGLIADHCAWTSGRWEELGINWNQLQNVPRDVKVLSNFLIRSYLQAKAGR